MGYVSIPKSELVWLLKHEMFNEMFRSQCAAVIRTQMMRLAGYDGYRYDMLPERLLLQALKLSQGPTALGGEGGYIRAEVGEEDIDEHVYDGIGSPGIANLSPVSHASLVGRVALELARRLEAELDGDDRPLSRADAPAPEMPP